MRPILLIALCLVSSLATGQSVAQKDWHSPDVACSLLADIPGMQTRGWKNDPDYKPENYWCACFYKEIGKSTLFSIKNNLAYYVDGDRNTAKQLKLVLNVNNRDDAETAHGALAAASGILTKRALNADLSDEVLLALLAGRAGKWKAGKNQIEVFREDWDNGKGYEVKFFIR